MVNFDVNAVFSRAEGAFQKGDYAGARRDLERVLRAMGQHPAVLHLLALVESRAGRPAAARAAFENALRQAPADPQINNNYGNFLDASGDAEAALRCYGKALASTPAFDEARLNRGVVLGRIGRLDAAIEDFDTVLMRQPARVSALVARGSAHLQAGRGGAAAADFDAALAHAPIDAAALQGRARVAMEQGAEVAAIGFYQRALAQAPGDPEIVLGLSEAMEAAGRDGAIALLAGAVARHPRWLAGQDSLARMRSEAGAAETLDQGYREALAAAPGDTALVFGHVACLARASRHADALAALDAAPASVRAEPGAGLYEAILASESGDLDRADRAFARLGEGDDARLARGRHALRRGDPAVAAAVLEPVARRDLASVTAWAHLGIAWRLLGDPRHEWLDGQPGLFAARDVGLEPAEIERLADVLRGLHRTRTHPIGQSLRGGTQTRGRLLGRPEPMISLLGERLQAAVAAHMAAMPPADATHPLLRHRDMPLRFTGSWSVRLTDGGFHVSHVHPAGVLSSACYIVVPDSIGEAGQPGWLEIGVPPVELGLDLPALATIEPRPGRLALFPSTMFHGTRPFPAGERLSVAFDVVA